MYFLLQHCQLLGEVVFDVSLVGLKAVGCDYYLRSISSPTGEQKGHRKAYIDIRRRYENRGDHSRIRPKHVQLPAAKLLPFDCEFGIAHDAGESMI